LDEAFAAIQYLDEFWWVAEIYRLKGKLLLSLNADNAAAEECFRRAIDIARCQSAKWLELRAANELARWCRAQGQYEEARALLAPVHSWFTEGFDLVDLNESKALLDELVSAP